MIDGKDISWVPSRKGMTELFDWCRACSTTTQVSLIEICKDSIIYQINRELRLLVDLVTFISIINLVDWRFIFLSEENCEKVCLTGSGLFIGVQENWQVSLLIRNWWMRFHVKFSKEKFHVATFIHESRFKV